MINRIRILRGILSIPKALYSTAITPNAENTSKNTKTLIQKLIDEFTQAEPIILKLGKYDQMNINFKEWKNRIDLMKKYGFSDMECFKMISEYPSLLEISLCNFEGSIQQWHLADLGINYFKLVLLKQPILFEVDETVIRSRVPQLRVFFGSTSNLAQLLINSPNVMHDNWQGVLIKIDYLLKNRRFKAEEISRCSALSQTLEFMKFRFDLLEKCGVYKQSRVPIHKVNKYDRSGHVNPSLKNILITNPEEFVRVAEISEEEYQVCRDLFMANEDDETDSDSDSDSYNQKL